MQKSYDVAIIGGGIIGNSIAAHLADENLKVILINSSDNGLPASFAAAGLLTPFQLNELENPLIKDFSMKSFHYFHNFYEKIKSFSNVEIGFHQPGTLYLVFSNFEIAGKETEIREFKKSDPKISFLNKQEAIKLEPQIPKEIIGAYYYPQECYINNPKFIKAITQYLIDNKISLSDNVIKEIILKNNQIENILLSNHEKISADKYVLCNGAYGNNFLKQLFKTNENLISAIKGEILQIEPVNEPVFEKILFCKEGYALPRPATNQYEQASVLIGSTSEEVSLDDNPNLYKTTLSGLSFLTSLTQKLLPNYKNCTIKNYWAGLRPKTKDSLPIIGKTSEIENLYLALGHYRNGILMGPYTGKLISELIVKNKCEYDIEPFNIERLINTSHKSSQKTANIR